MTTKQRDMLKGLIKEVLKERNDDSIEAQKIKGLR